MILRKWLPFIIIITGVLIGAIFSYKNHVKEIDNKLLICRNQFVENYYRIGHQKNKHLGPSLMLYLTDIKKDSWVDYSYIIHAKVLVALEQINKLLDESKMINECFLSIPNWYLSKYVNINSNEINIMEMYNINSNFWGQLEESRSNMLSEAKNNNLSWYMKNYEAFGSTLAQSSVNQAKHIKDIEKIQIPIDKYLENNAYILKEEFSKWDENQDTLVIQRAENLKRKKNTYWGYTCKTDCSWHEAGYNWAQANWITDENDCGWNSESFIEWCYVYVWEYKDETCLDWNGGCE